MDLAGRGAGSQHPVALPARLDAQFAASRAWLHEKRDRFYTSLFYAASCCGSLLTGWLTVRLAIGGWTIHSSRLAVFLTGSAMVACLLPVAMLSKGPLLLGLLLIVATGALGLNPLYYSLTQELSGRNQGKVGGSLSFCNWVMLAFMQARIGKLVKDNPPSTLGCSRPSDCYPSSPGSSCSSSGAAPHRQLARRFEQAEHRAGVEGDLGLAGSCGTTTGAKMNARLLLATEDPCDGRNNQALQHLF